MDDDAKKTTVLSKDNPLLQRAINQQSKDDTDELASEDSMEFLILIRGMVERAEIKEGDVIKLGRYEVNSKANEIDLTPYGATDRGVSRHHAQIHMEGDKVYITDTGSTNGTFLKGVRLEANTPTTLQKGNEILLGRLAVQVVFR